MVALAAGFLMVAAGFLMGMAAGTEAQSGAWASHWCGQSGCMQGGNAFEPHGLTVAMWVHEPWEETT